MEASSSMAMEICPELETTRLQWTTPTPSRAAIEEADGAGEAGGAAIVVGEEDEQLVGEEPLSPPGSCLGEGDCSYLGLDGSQPLACIQSRIIGHMIQKETVILLSKLVFVIFFEENKIE